mgnify:FL=1
MLFRSETALNYNKEAKIDNGTCEYCPCGWQVNANYNDRRPVSECNQKCVETEEHKREAEAKKEKEEAERLRKIEEGRRCTNCDLIEKLMNGKGGNVNLNLEMHTNGKKAVIDVNETPTININNPEEVKTAKVEKPKKVKKEKSNSDLSWFKRKAKVSEPTEPAKDHVSLF